MKNIEWTLATMLILMLITIGIVCSCAALQRPGTDRITVPPTPSTQLWQAAKESNWLVTLSILGIAAGTFATLNGQKWGISGIITCSVSLFMALAVARFAWWMAIFGMVGSVLLCVASILLRKRALIEIIKGGQRFKEEQTNMEPYDARKGFNTIQNEIQSESTKKIVKEIKGEI